MAVLIDKFHVTLDEIGDLTDRQLHELYCHKRSKEDGSIQIPQEELNLSSPEEELDLAGEIRQLHLLASRLKFTEANVRECEEKLKKKFANRPKKK